MTLKDHVKGKVRFQYFRDGNLFYKTDTGLLFPVPVEDTGKGIFQAEDSGIYFMRYIRKHLETLNNEKAQATNG